MTLDGLIHHPPAEWVRQLKVANSRGLRAGRVLACTRTFCTLLEAGDNVHQTRIPGRLHHLARRGQGLVPVVGDAVLFRPERPGREGVVEAVLPRRTCIVRQAPGRSGRQVPQVICANVDTVLIVTGLDIDFNIRRIERYLALVAGSGAEPVVILNKIDLCDHIEERLKLVRSLGCSSVLPVCAKTGTGIERLNPWMEPETTLAMLGSSGAGKSTLANLLLGQARQQTGELSRADGLGQHTTTHREMFRLPGGAFLIDNPGMREIQLFDEAADLEKAFADIIELGCRCRFSNCRHDQEPDCAVRAAVDSGDLDRQRYRNYLELEKQREKRQRDY